MQEQAIKIVNTIGIKHHLQDFPFFQNDVESYGELLLSIADIWLEGGNSKGKKRTKLWMLFLSQINGFIFNSDNNEINFYRCLTSGALIFSINPFKTMIFLKLSYLQNLFQMISPCPSKSTILKNCGNKSALISTEIPLILEFQNFMKNTCQDFDCLYDWSLYELSFDPTEFKFDCFKPLFNENSYNKKIIDLIIDDDQNGLSELFSSFEQENANFNQRFTMVNFKLPKLILDCPPYASLCVFFSAEKCFALICSLFQDGLESKQMRRKDYKGRTLFHFACYNGCIDIIEKMFDLNLDLYDIDNNGFSACHYAAMSGNTQVLSFLLENGYDVFSNHSPTYMTSYDVACFYGNLSFLKLIDQKVKNDIGINFTNLNCEHTPLCLACQGNNADVVEYILHKIDFNKQKEFGDIVIYSPFICSFEYNSVGCFKSLINNEFDKLLSLEKHKMLLIDAAEFGNVDIVMFLTKRGNIEESIYFKALNSAIINNHFDVVCYFINNNVVNVQDEESIAELFLNSFVSMQLVIFIDQTMKVPYSSKGKLFLQHACCKEDRDLVLFLLNKKCEFDFSIIEINKTSNSDFIQFLQKLLPTFADRALLKSDDKEISSKNDKTSIENMQSSFPMSNNDDGLRDKQIINVHKMKTKSPKNKMEEIDNDFYTILTDREKMQFESIRKHFREINKLSISDYYSLIHALSEFCSDKDDCRSIHRCALSGIIPTFEKIKYEGFEGTIIAINSTQLSRILNKSHNIFQVSFLHQNSIELSVEQINDLISNRIYLRDKILAYYRILIHLKYRFKFYFVKNCLNEWFHYDLIYFNPLCSSEDNNRKKYPNNIKFIHRWQKTQKLEKENKKLQKQLVKWKSFVTQIQDLINIVKDIFANDDYLEQNKNLLISNEELNTIDLSDEEAFDYANILFEDLKKIIYLINEYNVEKGKYNLESIVETIYSSNSAQKEIASQIIKDIVNHKSHHSWEESNVLKFSFLMKYCSSASYYRLFKFLNQKLPSPSTIDKHFLPMVAEREKMLTSSDQILPLLNQYWKDVKPKVEGILTEFNNKYHTNIDIKNYKINICLGCDAASFTTFACKKKKNENQNKIDEIKAALNSQKKRKNEIFVDLVNGNFKDEDESQSKRIEIPDDCSGYFFTLLIQPFIWKLPVTVVHLSKSINGHFSVNEAEDIKTLLKIINSHPHFKCKYFAADGETSLDEFHEDAFEKFESELENVIEGKISFEEFLDFVEENCFILPILDMLHAEKSGRNRIMNNDVKLGNNADVITKEKLIEDLDIHSSVLKDTSSIGRMKDSYPIHLFQIKNALNEFYINNNTSGLYLIIYSLLLEVFRNPYIEIQLRFDLTKLLFYLLVLLYKNIENLPESTGLRKNANSSNEYVWFQDRISMIKLINTVIGVAQVLRNPETSFYIGMERLSSHPEEQFFGNYRNHFNGHYIPKNALRYAVRSSLALDYANDLGVYFRIDKRENYAGAHLNFKNNDESETDVFTIVNHSIIHNNIIDIAFELYHIGTGEITDFSKLTADFLVSLSQFFEKYKSFRNSTFSTSKGVGIIPRIIGNVPNSKNEESNQVLDPSNIPINEFGELEINMNS